MSQQGCPCTLELVVTESLNGSVVTCFAGGSTSDPQVGNFTIITAGKNSFSTVIEIYSVVDQLTGQVTLLVSNSEMFGTAITFYGSVVGGSEWFSGSD